MEEYKQALAWNYDKGLDQQSVSDMSEMILKGMQDAGMAVNTDTAKAVLQTVMRLKPTEDQLRRFTEIHHMKFRSLVMQSTMWIILQEMLLIHTAARCRNT